MVLIARLASSQYYQHQHQHQHQPSSEDRAEARDEINRKLAIVAGVIPVSEIGVSISKASRLQPIKARVAKAHVTSNNNSNYNNDREEIGRKLALVAGIV